MKALFEKLIGTRESPIGRDTQVQRIGDYSVVRKIGSGGTSDVYLCLHREKLATAAIKQLSLKRAASAHQQMFQNESQLCGMLDHPNIVSLYGADLADPAGAHLVMEYVEGCSLDAHEEPDTLLAVDTVVDVIRQAAQGLQYLAAEGLVHRDIKPGNILLRKDGRVKLADFGCAIVPGQPQSALRVAGSLPFMSPEQISGERLTELSDMYSLGAVFYRLLTGHHPVEAEEDESPHSYARRIMAGRPAPIADYRPEVPTGLAAVVNKMLAKEPAARYDSWQTFLYTLQRSAAAGFPDTAEAYQQRWRALELQRRARSTPNDRSLSFGW